MAIPAAAARPSKSTLIRVRPEQPADRDAVFAIQEAAFGRPDEAELVCALRDSACPQLSLVAELAGRPVGHVFFSPVWIEPAHRAPPCAGLAPLAVQPAQQGRGVGAALVRSGLGGCAALGWSAVFLVGSPAYYGRFGFALAAPRGLRYASEAFDSAFQLIELQPGVLQGRRGWVRYPEAFSRTPR